MNDSPSFVTHKIQSMCDQLGVQIVPTPTRQETTLQEMQQTSRELLDELKKEIEGVRAQINEAKKEQQENRALMEKNRKLMDNIEAKTNSLTEEIQALQITVHEEQENQDEIQNFLDGVTSIVNTQLRVRGLNSLGLRSLECKDQDEK